MIYVYNNLMSLILNHNNRSQPSSRALLEEVQKLISLRVGSLLSSNQSSCTFFYWLKIDRLETKKVIVCFEERKNSFKLTLSSIVSIKGITGGLTALLKII